MVCQFLISLKTTEFKKRTFVKKESYVQSCSLEHDDFRIRINGVKSLGSSFSKLFFSVLCREHCMMSTNFTQYWGVAGNIVAGSINTKLSIQSPLCKLSCYKIVFYMLLLLLGVKMVINSCFMGVKYQGDKFNNRNFILCTLKICWSQQFNPVLSLNLTTSWENPSGVSAITVKVTLN